MKTISYMLSMMMVLLLAAGCTATEAETPAIVESEKIYTYEELAELPGDQLLDLFVEHGLEINDRLKTTFTEAELQKLFKSEFELLCKGVTARSDLMYFDLADQTKEIYQDITGDN